MELGHPQAARQGGLIALLFVLASCFTSTLAWAAGPRFNFNIPAGDAQKTLREFYSQSKIEMLYLTDTVRGMSTRAVAGNLEASEALEVMLNGTGLDFSFEEDFSFVSITPHVEERQAGTAEHVEVASASPRSESRDQSELIRHTFGNDPKLDEVVITGTLIRGVLDIVSPVEFLTKKEMKKSAYATVQDALQALPLNFGGGPSEDFSTAGNFSRGSSANLRGLGANATLVLVNGHRQPYSGIEADFVDLSNIAWSAVDRIEVLPDGASALYGSDAIAGVVNVVMRKDVNGAETQVRLGNASGGADERLISQLLGKTWDSGNVLLSYQFSERTSLSAADRVYSASSDKRSLGGSDYRSNRSNPGNFLDSRTLLPIFGIPSGQDGKSLTVADLLPNATNLQNRYDGVELLPDRRLHSFFLSGSQQVGERLEFFGEGRFSDRTITQRFLALDQVLLVPSTNAFYVNPTSQPFALVSYNFQDDLGLLEIRARTHTLSSTFGMKADLSDSWSMKLTGSYGSETLNYVGENMLNQAALRAALADKNRDTAFNPFGDGSHTNPATIEAIRFTERLRSKSQISSAGLVADGTAFELPSGPGKLAIGAEWREEQLQRGTDTSRLFGRKIESTFAELAVPLVGNAENPREVPRVELSLAARYERYSDFGTTSNPKIGLRWAPSDFLKVRTSWGTSFKAPKLADIYDSSKNISALASLRDQKSSSGISPVLVVQGNNPELEQETASTWTAGIDLAPSTIDGLNLSLTYYSIDYDDRVQLPGPLSPFDILLQEEDWSSVIHRNPAQADIDAICDSAVYSGSVSQCKAAPVAAIVDLRVRNIAVTRVRGLDFKVDHFMRTRYGRVDLGLNGSYVFSFEQSASNTSPLKDVVDTIGHPPALRMRGTVEWSQRDWDQPGFEVALTLDHHGSYVDPDSTLARKIEPLSTVDLRLGYRTADGSGAFDGMEFGLNASNVFNASPPFADIEAGYDPVNFEPFGRILSLNVQKRW